MPPKETMLAVAAPVAWTGTLAVAEGWMMAPVELGTVPLTPGTMGALRVGTGATGVALGATGDG
jgi:hypothetical protein